MLMTIVLPDGKRLHVRGAAGVPREGDHAMVMGVYYRVDAVVWHFGRELHDGDVSIPSMPAEIHLRPVAPPPYLEAPLATTQAPST